MNGSGWLLSGLLLSGLLLSGWLLCPFAQRVCHCSNTQRLAIPRFSSTCRRKYTQTHTHTHIKCTPVYPREPTCPQTVKCQARACTRVARTASCVVGFFFCWFFLCRAQQTVPVARKYHACPPCRPCRPSCKTKLNQVLPLFLCTFSLCLFVPRCS